MENNIMSFHDVCLACLNEPDYITQFNRLLHHELAKAKSPINAIIDKACNYDPDLEAMPDFVSCVYETVWIPLHKQYPDIFIDDTIINMDNKI